MSDQDELFKRRMADLAHRAENRGIYTFSGFLSLAEQDVMIRMERDLSFIGHSFYGGSEMAERRIAVFGSEKDFGYPPEYPVAVMAVAPLNEKFGEELSHRDYLGALMNLGIERTLIGDIIIHGKRAWFFCSDTITDFLSEQLTQVRHTQVSCRLAEKDVPELQPILEEMSINVASERLDAIVAQFTKLSRGHVNELFSAQRVTVNGRILISGSKPLKEGDVLSVRGFGKAIYDGINGESRKGRLYVTLRKYV